MKPVMEFNLPVGKFAIYSEMPAHALNVNQTHSGDVESYHGSDLSHCQADGIHFKISEIKGRPIIMKTADCLPVLILGKSDGAFLHAGWRGLEKKILLHPLVKQTQPYFAFIGPSIQVHNFEVTEEFRSYFGPKNFVQKDHKLFFNLQQEAKDQLTSAFPNIQVIDCGICTFDEPKLQSFRRQKAKVRNYNAFEA